MRLIDADALIAKCGNWYVEEGTEEGFISDVKHLIDLQPTIEERKDCTTCRYNDYEWYNEPCDSCTGRHKHWRPARKTGKWEIYVISPFDGEGCRCSECGYEGAPYWDYCSNCGSYNGDEE